jgi:hypothetical protein
VRGAKASATKREVRGAGATARGAKGGLRTAPRQRPDARRRASNVATPAGAREIAAIRKQLESISSPRTPRWNADPDDVRRSVLKLVLTLVELIRQLLERQAIRRMEGGTLTKEETESVGLALMKLQETITELAQQFDISPDELNLDLGPIGKLV